jgi:hypothetical protein
LSEPPAININFNCLAQAITRASVVDLYFRVEWRYASRFISENIRFGDVKN